MAEITGGLRRPLASPFVYSLIQRALGAPAVQRHAVQAHLRPVPGERILDLGCGPGTSLELLGDVHYTGVDMSERYIASALRRYGDRGTFILADVGEVELPDDAFDAVIALGMVHHLDDEAAERLFALAARALAPGGRLVTLDPAHVESQPALAAWLIGRDRGQAIRTPESYGDLARSRFGVCDVTVHHDLARVPYTHAIMVAREPAAVPADRR